MHEHGYQLPIKRRKLTLGARFGSIIKNVFHFNLLSII